MMNLISKCFNSFIQISEIMVHHLWVFSGIKKTTHKYIYIIKMITWYIFIYMVNKHKIVDVKWEGGTLIWDVNDVKKENISC